MRKNRMMRLASALLILTMVTTCAISGTFAKYVTSDTATDSARVAKWGVTIDVFGDVEDIATETIFGEKYDNAVSAGGVKVVSSETGKDVLAPGTEGTLATVTIAGTPEVMVDMEAKVDLELDENWVDADGDVYFPVIIKIGTTAIDVSSCTTLAEIETAVEDAIIDAIISGATAETDGNGRKAVKRYDANNPFASDADADVTVTWNWPFSTSDENDVRDTYLGDQAAAGTAANITFTYTVTATQVD